MSLWKPDINALIKADNREKLLKLLKHRSVTVRREVFDYLSTHNDDSLIYKAIYALSQDQDYSLRIHVIAHLAKEGDVAVLSGLREVVLEGQTPEKIDALRIIADYGDKDDIDITNIIVQALHDKKPLVKVEAIRTLGGMQILHEVKNIIACLHDPHSPIRIEAAKTLGKLPSDEAITALIGALLDTHQEVRSAARASLAGINSEQAKHALHNAAFQLLLQRMNSDVGSKEDTILYIGREKIQEGVPLLYQACRDSYKNIRLQAVKALREFRDPKALDVLQRLIDDYYYDVRIETIKTLEKIIEPASLIIIEKARRDKNSNVRKEAERAYYVMQGKL